MAVSKSEALEGLRARLEQNVREAELERAEANTNAGNLQRRVRRLEAELRKVKRVSSDVLAMSAIKKLATDHSVGRRLAAVIHPDKVPSELTDSASELFCFLQTIREPSEGCTMSV